MCCRRLGAGQVPLSPTAATLRVVRVDKLPKLADAQPLTIELEAKLMSEGCVCHASSGTLPHDAGCVKAQFLG
jgi:hypothetical protein